MKKNLDKVLCPEDCIYRNKVAHFCGYCMNRILNEEEKKDANRKAEAKHTE